MEAVGKYILLKLQTVSPKTKSGLFKTDELIEEEKKNFGLFQEVVSVGDKVTIKVSVGDKVALRMGRGIAYEINGDTYGLAHEEDVAIVE